MLLLILKIQLRNNEKSGNCINWLLMNYEFGNQNIQVYTI